MRDNSRGDCGSALPVRSQQPHAGQCRHLHALKLPGNADGYVIPGSKGFDLFGADNNIGSTATGYVATALTNETLGFNWTYTTHDTGGSYWDPADGVDGSTINPATGRPWLFVPTTLTFGQSLTGSVTLTLMAGDTYGFFVNSLDSANGRGEIAGRHPRSGCTAAAGNRPRHGGAARSAPTSQARARRSGRHGGGGPPLRRPLCGETRHLRFWSGRRVPCRCLRRPSRS